MNRAQRRSQRPDITAWIRGLEDIARLVGCTCGPMQSELLSHHGKQVVRLTHSESCVLTTASFYRDGSSPTPERYPLP